MSSKLVVCGTVVLLERVSIQFDAFFVDRLVCVLRSGVVFAFVRFPCAWGHFAEVRGDNGYLRRVLFLFFLLRWYREALEAELKAAEEEAEAKRQADQQARDEASLLRYFKSSLPA